MVFKYEKFKFAGVDNVIVNQDIFSDKMMLEDNYIWNITPVAVSPITGSPTYTVEVSNDGENWLHYDTKYTGLAITSAPEVVGISFLYMRISVISNGADGSVSFIMGRKTI